MRARETLNLLARDLVETPSGFVVCLPTAKTGHDQRVAVTQPSVVNWLRAYIEAIKPAPGDRLFPVHYNTFLKWVIWLGEWLEYPLRLTTHSFRRSGATALIQGGMDYASVMLYGRWAKAAKEYIRRGDAMLLTMRAASTACMRRTQLYLLLCPRVFEIRALLGHDSLVSTSRVNKLFVLDLERRLLAVLR